MRKRVRIIIWTILLVAVAVLVAVRWQAWFGMPEEPEWTGDTLVYTMPTLMDVEAQEALAHPEDSVLTLLVLGDIHNGLTQADYDTLAARVPEVDVVTQCGDWLERGQGYYYQALLHEWMPSALSGVPVVACPGNHEYNKGIRKELSPVWDEAFPRPDNGPQEVPGAHFYVDLPGLRLIAIDTNPLVHLVHLTRTLTWLRETMNGAKGRFVVVMMHHPVLPACKGRFNPLVYASFRRALGDADLVISGHDHSYMRRSSFVVVNAAGQPKEPGTGLQADVRDTVPVYGVMKVENLQSSISNLQFTVHRMDDGEVIDSLYVCHD